MGIKGEPWTSTPPFKRNFSQTFLFGVSKHTKGHVKLIHQWAERGPLVEGYISRRLHLFGCFFAYVRGTLLWQWELWVHFLLLCIPFFAAVAFYKEPDYRFLRTELELLHGWVSGYSQFFLGLYISVVLHRYFKCFETMGNIFGSSQNLALAVSALIHPANEDDDKFDEIKKKLAGWINLGWQIMVLQAHFSEEEWVAYLKEHEYMTDEDWQVLGPLNKYDRGAMVYNWIDHGLMYCALHGRVLYPEFALLKMMDRVASARGNSLDFDVTWNVPLPYAYVIFISAMIKLLLISEAVILGMGVHLAEVMDHENGMEAITFPRWSVILCQLLFLLVINAVLYSAVSIQAIFENPWGSAIEDVFIGTGQHASHICFEELVSLLENRVMNIFDRSLTHDVLRVFRQPAPDRAAFDGLERRAGWLGRTQSMNTSEASTKMLHRFNTFKAKERRVDAHLGHMGQVASSCSDVNMSEQAEDDWSDGEAAEGPQGEPVTPHGGGGSIVSSRLRKVSFGGSQEKRDRSGSWWSHRSNRSRRSQVAAEDSQGLAQDASGVFTPKARPAANDGEAAVVI